MFDIGLAHAEQKKRFTMSHDYNVELYKKKSYN